MTVDRAGSPPRSSALRAPRSRISALEWTAFGLTLLAVSPWLLTAYPPIGDLPNHAARLFLECRRGDPQLAAMYVVRPALIPNLSLDLVNLGLCGVLSPIGVVKAVLVASVGLMTLA